MLSAMMVIVKSNDNRHTQFFKTGHVDHWVKALAIKPEDLNLIPRTHMYETNS